MMFFVRTQLQRGGQRTPEYTFTPEQFAAFNRLIEEAKGRQNDGCTDEAEDEGDDGREGEDSRQQSKLGGVQRACLDFCIELLDYRSAGEDCDSALVCASAILGVEPTGDNWRPPQTYTPILSSIIKVAKCMIVQKAIEMAPPADEASLFSAGRPFGFGSSSSSNGGAVGANKLQSVTETMGRLMMRDSNSHSPMQLLLDFRAHGMMINMNIMTKGQGESMHDPTDG
ncbi:hypothetical protein DIS24_g8170 [Lasiodiplodia hormozganensis]|uniref:Uncharacterized protein n=1 Tax=Lasiodiplodia hormozganensis TaxID=869390 RepID=A0AA40CNJ5_9PEZI|nr:hypothetical protein DIS24_g8170 [Lasiodiplodia hormozganensis]